jgi:hypothetical protein
MSNMKNRRDIISAAQKLAERNRVVYKEAYSGMLKYSQDNHITMYILATRILRGELHNINTLGNRE